jgi:hypothetical protein
MLQELEDAEFHGKRIRGEEEREPTGQARELLELVHASAESL